ncbi:MAG: lysophospholipid acyltransferase family protein [Alphaproteobacteria bacterium]|nr:lysophospholipid acyltransferase family protein [Alphaproteobacteria bacterium]MBT5389511.1 lysophospholipid acyltransferase family protein [Alphaproteobacteria bacterium]MBT5654285.1 lysophospholipid acyltransferase family protein [Alphaproteobacteria bacterium]
MKHTIKQILKHPITQAILAWVCAQYLRVVFWTCRWQYVGEEFPNTYCADNRPFITCFWHNRLMMLAYAWRWKRPFHMLISSHPDGKLIAKVMGHVGIKTLAGSSTRGGTAALRNMLKILKSGGTTGITPDGPKGPRFIAKDGIVNMAYLAKADILPVAFSVSRHKLFNTWDRFLWAKPFGKGIFLWGAPIPHPKTNSKAEFEKTRKQIERELINISERADQSCNVTGVAA